MHSVSIPGKMTRRLANFAAKRGISEIDCVQESLEQFFLDVEGDEQAAEIARAP